MGCPMGIIGISTPLLLDLGNDNSPPGIGDGSLSEGERRGAGSGDRALLEYKGFLGTMEKEQRFLKIMENLERV